MVEHCYGVGVFWGIGLWSRWSSCLKNLARCGRAILPRPPLSDEQFFLWSLERFGSLTLALLRRASHLKVTYPVGGPWPEFVNSETISSPVFIFIPLKKKVWAAIKLKGAMKRLSRAMKSPVFIPLKGAL